MRTEQIAALIRFHPNLVKKFVVRVAQNGKLCLNFQKLLKPVFGRFLCCDQHEPLHVFYKRTMLTNSEN